MLEEMMAQYERGKQELSGMWSSIDGEMIAAKASDALKRAAGTPENANMTQAIETSRSGGEAVQLEAGLFEDTIADTVAPDLEAEAVEVDSGISLVDKIISDFDKSEGIFKHKSVEGGADTMPYGLKEGMADLNMADFTGPDGVVDYKSAATNLINQRVGQLQSSYPEFDDMRSGLQETLVSTVWNQGMSGADELKKSLNAAMDLTGEDQVKAVQSSLKNQLLDGVSTNDPKDGKMRPLGGLIARKAADYNMAAESYGFPPISSWKLEKDLVKIGDKTYREKVTYLDAEGNEIMSHRKQSNRHSKSMTNEGSLD
jgi:hypothetical protein|tara:strand:+ start:49 stop:990 length:942 start_codon:yes stop_codon:yes gene_type:complete